MLHSTRGLRRWFLFTLICSAFVATALGQSSWVYVGTYTGPKSKGIYVSRFDGKTGELGVPELAATLASPSFLAVAPDGRRLYAVNEVADFSGRKSGAVSALAIDSATGQLNLINQKPSGGAGPCHLTVDATGRHVLAANYGGGSISVLPIRPDGALGDATAFLQHQGSSVNPRRQEGPHAHGIYLDTPNRHAIVPDLGLDKLMIYRFDAGQGTLTSADPAFASAAPGAGPRHFAFHPKGGLACAIYELNSTLTSFRYDSAQGRLTPLDTVSTLPAPVPGSSTAEVFFHPNGRFVYGSNRGHDSIVVCSIEAETGKLQSLQHQPTGGKTPRSFAIDPTGRWMLVANQGSDNIVVFAVDPDTGRLTPTGRERKDIGSPVCLLFVPAGR